METMEVTRNKEMAQQFRNKTKFFENFPVQIWIEYYKNGQTPSELFSIVDQSVRSLARSKIDVDKNDNISVIRDEITKQIQMLGSNYVFERAEVTIRNDGKKTPLDLSPGSDSPISRLPVYRIEDHREYSGQVRVNVYLSPTGGRKSKRKSNRKKRKYSKRR